MKTTMKKTAAYLLALLLALQMVPAFADTITSNEIQTESELLETLKIINESGKTVLVGKTLQLYLPYGYDSAKWSSSDEKIATVDQDGMVTGVEAGEVKITATHDGDSSSITLTVIAPAEAKEGSENESMTIIVSGNKIKVPYDGQPHAIEYTYSSDRDDFNQANVKMNVEAPSRTTAGATRGTLTADDFTYTDESVDATFIVNDGSVWITPIEATVTADDMTIALEELDNLDPTATVSGLIGDDELDYRFLLPDITEAGEYEIKPVGDQAQLGYSVTYEAGKLTVTAPESKGMVTADLYNLAKVGGTWYRLRKTTFKVDKPIGDYLTGVTKDGTNVPLDPENYEAADYDFANEILEYNSKRYAYMSRRNEKGLGVDGYYTATLNKTETLTAVKNKIGAGTATKGNWLIAQEYRYDDPYATDSFHRNYTIVFHEKAALENQTLYNMLAIGTATDYYKLRATTISAIPAKDQTTGAVVDPETYEMAPYDFTNLVLDVDNVKYVYSSDGQEDEYTSYYTVSLENVKKEVRFNNKANWFTDTTKWLDGASKELLGVTSNDTMGYHANYRATLHQGKKRNRSVTIESSWPSDKPAYKGTIITLTAKLTGFEGQNYKLQWQRRLENGDWQNVPGENGITMTYELNEETAAYIWRVVASDI